MTASPDFFAESAKNSDHSPDQPASAAGPSEEEIALAIRPMSYEGADLTECVARIYALFAPILSEKERGTERACANHANATIGWERERGRSEELEARALAAEAALAKAIVFELGEHHYVESRGDGTWAIKNGGCVLNVDGVWEYEPSPSNRTDEFIARTRFDREDAFRRAAAIRSQEQP